MIYLDNCATTPLSFAVQQDIFDKFSLFGNPSSNYEIGLQAKRVIESSREKIAKCLQCDPDEIYFTSGASESNTWALQEPFLCFDFEHHSITNNPNRVDSLEDAKIYTEMLVNNEVGFINPCLRFENKRFHCDATQAIGNIKLNLSEFDVDTLSFSGHKFHAPKGIGVLYIRHGIELKPLIYGGKQEHGLRGGTENVIGISALGVAIEDAFVNIERKYDHCVKLRNRLLDNLDYYNIKYIENRQLYDCDNIPSILSISIKDIQSEPVMNLLELKDIYISNGSACNTGSLEPSDTLKFLGIPDDYINGTFRISFDLSNTTKEIDTFCYEFKEAIDMVKRRK